MNRFLSKKKPTAAELSPPPQTNRKWKKNSHKKEAVEAKPQLDLDTILPPTDDFRTSLIMPNLSARFSMLREQDDPNSLLGKASDDSVLQPQRNSRLLDFGFPNNNLNDIAEVASINSSIRPPFASGCHGSTASEEGYGTDNDSTNASGVMSRARPGEGNVLFGGRQKVYKIATGSARSLSGGNERVKGKLLYDDDVSMSAFQRYKKQERERLLAAGADVESDSAPMSPVTDPDRRASDDHPKGLGLSTTDPGFVFVEKRRSDSTTNSNPSQEHSSSAATSVASQPIGAAVTTSAATTKTSPSPAGPGLERSQTKRRLYEQGLNQHMHDQQASNLTRLNSIQRQRAPTVGAMPSSSLNHSKSSGNLHDRRAYKPYALQPNSPPLLRNNVPTLNTFTNLSAKPSSSASSPVVTSFPQSPISPVIPETEEYQVLSSALEPNDRGKATALGAFNKPSQQFNEQQYLQRQMQMENSKESLPLGPSPKPSPVAEEAPARPSVEGASADPDQTPVDPAQPGQAPVGPAQPHQTPVGSVTAGSSHVSAESTAQDSGLARFDSARQNSVSHASQRSPSPSLSSPPEDAPNKAFAVFQKAATQNRVAHGDSPVQPGEPTFDEGQRTFFGASDDDSDYDDGSDANGAPAGYTGFYAPNTLPSVSEHPALRNEDIPEVDEEDEERDLRLLATALPGIEPVPDPSGEQGTTAELHGLDSPTIGTQEALGGLIHQHLRNTSNVSSLYPPGSSSGPLQSPNNFGSFNFSDTQSGSNAWDLDELDRYYGGVDSQRPYSRAVSKEQEMAPGPLKPYEPRSSGDLPDDSEDASGTAWQSDFKKQHNRDASTATQAEREAFDNELAARQRAIQEKMKNLVESESRGPSPGPSQAGALKAFGMLKSRPSHETLSSKYEPSVKPSKMLGLGLTGAHPAERSQPYDDRSPHPAANAGAAWPLGPGPIPNPETEMGTRAPPSRAPSQQAMRESSRTRSSSGASRARSRSRSIRQDGSPAAGGTPGFPSVVRPSPEVNQFRSPSVEGRGRMRSNSRAAGLHPSARGTPNGPSPSHSPASAFGQSAGSTPRAAMMSPPTGASKASAIRPPFHKSSSAPMPSVPLGKPRGELLRKKTINKFDISEPTLVSSTSNIDTVELPPGASLRNGMDEIYAAAQQQQQQQQQQQPAVATRRRKLFGRGNKASMEDMRSNYSDGVASPPLSGLASPPMRPMVPAFISSSQEHIMQRKPSVEASSIYPQTVRSQESFDTSAGSARFDAVGSPVLNEAGMF